MDISRAMLAASIGVLGLMFYLIGGLLLILAATVIFRGDIGGPSPLQLLIIGAVFGATGYGFRFVATKIA